MIAVDNKKRQAISEALEKLPEDLHKALFAPETTDSVQAVGKNAGLMIDKIGEFADETGLVMLGITPPSDYVKNLTRRLGVEQEKAKAIAEEINQQIFKPVRESLKRIHGLAPTETVGAKAPTALPSSTSPRGKTLGVFGDSTPSVEERGGVFPGGTEQKPLPTREDIRPATPSMPQPLIIEPAPSAGKKEEAKIIPPIFVKTYQSTDPYREPME
ncbi:hypothetical protein A2926_02510 [Candidatus Giovannonibacteria bacterium RIFCSPLOWO2_01_FULL_44_40]|uniref:Uncharacterized protein n=1 Tax=Candidatus Giovannonibacteria bacterium RIFCSPHIGHO2_01_FULL_45_23 TaxID=1798325 RepID=A0A1F5VJD4_9BACT|nr:MAG: hypothetical protein A2834_01505 [Candidatus Giovannonibacteria bacterium RIFCSPHIGHO2_01_FULL_45_23]OGF76823.1 MAG: hypothetical protein A3C77_00275 [Candidatus Giovannonibacteria bacterium RIFCSPHIGHO2_02_FULL_45_13]OGF80231.1 MAG: hypothetical protein A2926_02510 [Candidatus Giovannonibacteria bacterium RIFCSPLOWO2_01_FULL_44_40]